RAHPDILRRCVLAKQVDDLCSAPLLQAAAAHYLDAGRYDLHLPRITDAYGKRARLMIDCLKQHFGDDLSLLEPEGGMLLWERLTKTDSAGDMLLMAIEESVMFVPGAAFHAEQQDTQSFRLSFSMSTEAQIREGCARLFR